MSEDTLTSEYFLSALEVSNDSKAKAEFFRALAIAVKKCPKLAQDGYPAAVKAIYDPDEVIWLEALRALDVILEIRPALPSAAEVEHLTRFYFSHYEEPVGNGPPRVPHSYVSNICEPVAGAAAALPVLIDLMGPPQKMLREISSEAQAVEVYKADDNRRIPYSSIVEIALKHPTLAAATLPTSLRALFSINDQLQIEALTSIDDIIQRQPQLASQAILDQIDAMARHDPDETVREEAADILKCFVEKHRKRTDELLPNIRLKRATEALLHIG